MTSRGAMERWARACCSTRSGNGVASSARSRRAAPSAAATGSCPGANAGDPKKLVLGLHGSTCVLVRREDPNRLLFGWGGGKSAAPRWTLGHFKAHLKEGMDKESWKTMLPGVRGSAQVAEMKDSMKVLDALTPEELDSDVKVEGLRLTRVARASEQTLPYCADRRPGEPGTSGRSRRRSGRHTSKKDDFRCYFEQTRLSRTQAPTC